MRTDEAQGTWWDGGVVGGDYDFNSTSGERKGGGGGVAGVTL